MNGNMRDVLLAMAMRHDGDFKKIYNDLQTKAPYTPEEINQAKQSTKYKYITIIDSDYPEILKEKNAPPFVLFYEGNLKLLDSKLPIKEMLTMSDNRAISTIKPITRQTKVELDYFVGCENQNDMKQLLSYMKGKGVDFKNYDKKDKTRER